MDTIGKYYRVSEILNDNLKDVAIALRIAGCTDKPAYIHQELCEGRVEKFDNDFDFLMDAITNEKARYLLFAYIRDFKKLSHKFHFSMTHETSIGAINEQYKGKTKSVRVMVHEEKENKQMLFLFEGE